MSDATRAAELMAQADAVLANPRRLQGIVGAYDLSVEKLVWTNLARALVHVDAARMGNTEGRYQVIDALAEVRARLRTTTKELLERQLISPEEKNNE